MLEASSGPRRSRTVPAGQRRARSSGAERGPDPCPSGTGPGGPALDGGTARSESERLLANWPPTLRAWIDGIGEVLFCHATPRSDTEIFTRLTPENRLLPVFEGLDVPLVVCGHTHMQFDRTVGKVRVVNAGSVGMPFGEPGAYWLLLGPDVQLRHTPYDLAQAAERIRATSFPQAQSFAAQNVLQPPSERTILEAFTKAELK